MLVRSSCTPVRSFVCMLQCMCLEPQLRLCVKSRLCGQAMAVTAATPPSCTLYCFCTLLMANQKRGKITCDLSMNELQDVCG